MPTNTTQDEVARRLAWGMERVSLQGLIARVEALGYRLDRDLDCRSTARDMKTGDSYPCLTTGLKEANTGVSAFHYRDARRDNNFQALQALRRSTFAVLRGAIFDI